MANKFHQGKYTVKKPEKYAGNINEVYFRSSYELKTFLWLEETSNILLWVSEETVIPYISPIDNKPHRYFVDLAVKYKQGDGSIKNALVEIKPASQTLEPKKPKRITKAYLTAVQTYMINEAKWKAARKWCEEKGWDFIILTEKEIFGK